MDRRYRLVCQCLDLLRDSDFTYKTRYRLEADFILIKVALLKEADSPPAKAHKYDELYFQDLLAQIRSLTEKGFDSGDLENLSSQLQPVISALSCLAPSS